MVVFFWILFSVVVGIVGSDRKIGFGAAFICSLLLSPLIGLIITLISPTKASLALQAKMLDEQKKTNELLKQPNFSVSQELLNIQRMRESGTLSEEE